MLEDYFEIAEILGCTKDKKELLKIYDQFSICKNAPAYSKDLLDALIKRNFSSLDQLLETYGKGIFQQKIYTSSDNRYYETVSKLNAFSVISRLFFASSANWFMKNKIEIPYKEFLDRDQKEANFFHWAMLDLHPYVTRFFEKISEELKL